MTPTVASPGRTPANRMTATELDRRGGTNGAGHRDTRTRGPLGLGARAVSVPRVAVLDDHPVVRAGVRAMLERRPEMAFAGMAADEFELWPLLYRTRPTVLVLDVHHPGRDGLALCLELKQTALAPRIVLHSGSRFEDVLVPALVAGADAIVSKADVERNLLAAIRGTRGASSAHEVDVPPRLQAAAAARLDPTDRAILAMRLAGTTTGDVAATLGIGRAAVAKRLLAIVAWLTPPGQASLPATAQDEDARSDPPRIVARRGDPCDGAGDAVNRGSAGPVSAGH